MNQKLKWLLGLGVFALVLVGSLALYNNLAGGNLPQDQLNQSETPTAPQDESQAPAGTATAQDEQELTLAPDFTMTDRDGNEVALADFLGKPIVLNFWASWCGPCQREMPDFEAAYQSYGDEVQFIMVNLTGSNGETVESGRGFIDDEGYTFPIYFDSLNQNGAVTYGITGIPTSIFINDEGYIVASAVRMLTAEEIDRGIDLILE